MFTLDRQSNERIVTGGEPPVGEDRSVDPGEEGREAGVHVRKVLWNCHFDLLAMINDKFLHTDLDFRNLRESMTNDTGQSMDTILLHCKRSTTVALTIEED